MTTVLPFVVRHWPVEEFNQVRKAAPTKLRGVSTEVEPQFICGSIPREKPSSGGVLTEIEPHFLRLYSEGEARRGEAVLTEGQ